MPTQGTMIHTVGPGGQTLTVQSEAMLQTVGKMLSVTGQATPTAVSLTTGASPTTSAAAGQQIMVTAPAGKSPMSGAVSEIEMEDKKQ